MDKVLLGSKPETEELTVDTQGPAPSQLQMTGMSPTAGVTSRERWTEASRRPNSKVMGVGWRHSRKLNKAGAHWSAGIS